jgi:glycosyltransferase involved in cell wall biosynthesis
MKKILFVVNTDWFFISHRLPIAIEAIRQGYEVHLAASISSNDNISLLELEGLHVHGLIIDRKSKNPISAIFTIIRLYILFKKIKPDLVHLVTIKPVLFGGLAARLAKIPAIVAAISGLGHIFTEGNRHYFLKKIVTQLYKRALCHENIKIIFQNIDDKNILIRNSLCTNRQSVLIKGSGVDLVKYQLKPEPKGKMQVIFAARLLKEKGIFEFIEAAKVLHSEKIDCCFLLAGGLDQGNPSSISNNDLISLIKDKNIRYLGYREDMADILSKSNIVVLPSYREGLPKVLIEAAACGRAVITTDVPGCRDAIINNETGILVGVKNSIQLAEAIKLLVQNQPLREKLGKNGRLLAENEFDIKDVVQRHLSIYQQLLNVTIQR